MKKVLLKTLITTFVVSALLGIIIIILDLWNDTTSKIFLSTITIFGFSIPGLICSTNYEKEKYKTFSLIGIITCLVSCIYTLLLIWASSIMDVLGDWNLKLILSCILMSSSFGHISLLLLINSNNKSAKYCKIGTVILSAVIDILLLVIIFSEKELSWKLILVLAILIVLGTVTTPLLNKLSDDKAINKNN